MLLCASFPNFVLIFKSNIKSQWQVVWMISFIYIDLSTWLEGICNRVTLGIMKIEIGQILERMLSPKFHRNLPSGYIWEVIWSTHRRIVDNIPLHFKLDRLSASGSTRAVGRQRARLYASYSHKALFHYIALKYF